MILKRRTQSALRLGRRGATLVYVAVALVGLLGLTALTFDLGRMVIAKQRAQEVCDAAALAGGWYLTGEVSSTRSDQSSGTPTTGDGSAARAAKYVALAANESVPQWTTLTVNSDQPGVTVSFPPLPAPQGFVQADNGAQVAVKPGEAIRVEAVVNVPMTFARILGIQQTRVYAQAVAVVGLSHQTPTPVTVTGSALPFAVADTTIWDSANPPNVIIQMGTRVAMKVANPGDPENFIGPGNFIAVSYPGDRGANDYEERLAGTGPPVTFVLNQPLTIATEPGNMTGPTERGLVRRLTGDPYPYPSANSTAWQDWLASYDPATGTRTKTKRIGLVPIVRDPGGSLHGRGSLDVVGFTGVFIEGFETVEIDGQTYSRLYARFTNGVYTADGITWLDPEVSPPYSSTVTSVKLLS